MKFVVIGESSGATMEQIMAVYPRHKAVVDELVARDPFNLEGLVKRYVIREWSGSMLT